MHHLLHTAAVILVVAEAIPFVIGSTLFGTIGYKIGKRKSG